MPQTGGRSCADASIAAASRLPLALAQRWVLYPVAVAMPALSRATADCCSAVPIGVPLLLLLLASRLPTSRCKDAPAAPVNAQFCGDGLVCTC
jgi:hypothetical protein